ncbi:MAG: dTDP-4-dehydrorhamnose reductase [Acidobacteria bacterium]|nr:MAG: dTDP-4-dehydrorhamnose reductase [Acidobacteriota bacterium]
MRLLVCGASGQLGAAIVKMFTNRADVVPMTRAALDIADAAAVGRAVADASPEAIVNCAAYNDVDGAEDDASTALSANAIGVLTLARAARSRGATFVHYSTDFVFDGTLDRPYTEDDEPKPQSVYAASKLLGEWFAADAPSHYVLRVESLFGGPRRRSTVDRIVDAVRDGKPSRVFVDRTVSPSYVEDVAGATARLLALRPASGVYHCVNSGWTTWYELAKRIVEILDRPAELVPVRVADVPLRARRPQYAALSNRKLRDAGIEMPSWEEALARYLTSP